ncbi:MAG: tetratricopeptide repeat protein [Parvularculaceae bacterium]
MTAFRYKAFLSYSWRDRSAAEALHRALETWRPPTNRRAEPPLRPIFRDRDEEAAGASLRTAIEDALDNAEFLIVVCSPNSAASPWVNKEIAYFRKKRTPANILCYAINGDPGSSAIPPALFFETDIDGTLKDTPIDAPLAADARAEGDGVRLARLKIIAAMMNVGLDDLVRRDSVRRVRRLRRLLAGASALAVAFAGVALYAFAQRDFAVKNEARAKREAMKAERTAEFMVGLFEVPDPSESRGREVTAREILDKGVKTIETDLAAEPDVQASLMHTMGRSYTGLGLYPDAARILTVARDKRIEAKADTGDLYATKVALARAEFEKGDLEAAHDLYAALVKEAEADIAKGDWRAEYANALIGMGETTLYRDTPEEAQAYYELARDLLETREEKSYLMAQTLRGLANSLEAQNDFKSSKKLLVKTLSLGRENKKLPMPFVASTLNDLAHAEYRLRDLDSAMANAAKVVEIDKAILGPEHPEYLISANNLARYEFENGNLEEAFNRMSDVLKHDDMLGAYFGEDFSYFLNTMGEMEAALNHPARASDYFKRAMLTADGRAHRIYSVAMINMGLVRCSLGEVKTGMEAIEEGRNLLAEHYSEADWRYGIADEFESRCLFESHDQESAQSFADAAAQRLQRELGDDHFFTRRALEWRDELAKQHSGER